MKEKSCVTLCDCPCGCSMPTQSSFLITKCNHCAAGMCDRTEEQACDDCGKKTVSADLKRVPVGRSDDKYVCKNGCDPQAIKAAELMEDRAILGPYFNKVRR